MFHKYILVCILLFAFIIRVYGINWDQNQHLHPDERFLTMVVGAQKIPPSLSVYLDTAHSKLNPNNIGFSFYVYGMFPLVLIKYLVVFLRLDDYNNITLVGRAISALFDCGIIFFIYALTLQFEKHLQFDFRIKYVAAFLYSVMVLPIQQAHFFTVDTFVTFFMLGTTYFALRYYYDRKLWNLIVCGIFLGLGVASKINAIYVIPIVLAFLLPQNKKELLRAENLFHYILKVLFFTFVSYIFLRFFDPYLFQSNNFFIPTINPLFLKNILELQALSNPTVWFPPGVQWITKTKILFPLINLAVFGVGIVTFILAIFGAKDLLNKHRKFEVWLLGLWVLGIFVYLSMQFTMTMRYYYILYPFLAISAGYFLTTLVIPNLFRNLIITLVLLWPLSFMAIYTRPHSRVTASEWMYQNIPNGAVLAQEHWDDSLPVPLPNQNKTYNTVQMGVFGQDTPEKWIEINKTLATADYIIFTSNRGYGSIGSVPERFPVMSKFYTDLFAEKLQFKKIKEFTSYPTLPSCYMLHVACFMFDDQWSEEAFTVYDHPRVTIFKKL
ncbi:hypothetical protein A3D80_01215 [Candidatus Roizmanbacteria bacterium RIFCSPHIGHO2_02_FULL_40_13b]|uniref:Glycosyltransferase RgtA/B/C/D-like domain-containing protein n=1 Tax=Candidatus Roizmanbacteria bacterium RIFCSPHIGHO2_01_FULL_39_24 TaxID=1802032 RepID=A0A1F7GI30_9BACT|nr:MAG: hypothetical protein A2799_02970 [Candidatus Roizmanbacteria bacterium RIFCSPHIGHO2_01_FULL_39_24]OGK26344.1 MAG: hypothetical protein A3D80_01215 [Candidatus Roizmanbacteria bacterium RIFCSPHIGHO2_02_FULL_40_13b]OGK49754.1 MAG: hypothetical protein A3A56_00475 [Candidatus Roizmanbacteria bacterium RIFCSPLOWO2_01_FULL_40_32]